MVSRLIFAALAALLLPQAALANDLEGRWALRIDDANIFVFQLEEDAEGEWSGSWIRPERFAGSGVVFAMLSGSVEVEADGASTLGDAVALRFEDRRPGAVPDVFRFRLVAENRAELTYVGTGFDPYPLIRVPRDAGVGPFDAERLYDRDNAVTEAEFVEVAEPEAESETVAADEAVAEEPSPRVGDDFLDDLDPQ